MRNLSVQSLTIGVNSLTAKACLNSEHKLNGEKSG
jgi:hypothetical protein